MFWSMANAFLHVFPGIALYVLIFKNHFRVPMKFIYLEAVALLVFGVFAPTYIFQNLARPEEWVMIYSVIYLSLLIFACAISTNFSIYRILLVFFILGGYLDAITLMKETFGPMLIDILPTWDYHSLTVVARFIGSIVSFPFMALFSTKMIRPVMDRSTSKTYFKYLWITPACFFVMYRLCINPEEHLIFFVFHDVPTIASWVWVLGTFILTYNVLKMLIMIMDQEELERKLEISSLNASMQMKQYENLVHQVEDTKVIRHDLRHHLLAIKSYFNTEDYNGMKKYLNSLVYDLELDTQIVYCDNVIFNGILKHFYQIAKDSKIEYEIHVRVPKEININDKDLGVLVGNTIENAMEACRRQQIGARFIHVKAQMFGNAFTMVVENSFDGKIVEGLNGTFISSKRNEEGIGISSIRQICDKYNGVCKINYEHHVFRLSVLLNQEEKNTLASV